MAALATAHKQAAMTFGKSQEHKFAVNAARAVRFASILLHGHHNTRAADTRRVQQLTWAQSFLQACLLHTLACNAQNSRAGMFWCVIFCGFVSCSRVCALLQHEVQYAVSAITPLHHDIDAQVITC